MDNEITGAKAPSPHVGPRPTSTNSLNSNELRQSLLRLGADDAGFVEIGRAGLTPQRHEIIATLPETQTLISLVFQIHPESVRSAVRSVAGAEYYQVEKAGQAMARAALFHLSSMGIRAVASPMGFPMEMTRWAGRVWTVDHKTIAVEAGLGRMGTSRLILHPRFGSCVYFSTILIDREVTAYGQPLDKSPCDKCNLCVAVCPTGAIHQDGSFNFMGCITHTYRDKVGGFIDWVEKVAEGGGAKGLRRRVTDAETMSIWQGLAYHPVNKCDYCMAVCPAGAIQHPPYEADKKGYHQRVVDPFRHGTETVYAAPGSDAVAYVRKRFPHKPLKLVFHGIRPNSVPAFITALPHLFQPEASHGLSYVYHFTFTGASQAKLTVVIKDKNITTAESHEGTADVSIIADSDTWIGFLNKERNIVWAIVTGKVKVTGGLDRFKAFGKCFPL
jgi:epoxyqueuosine reductase QueG